MPEGMVSIVHTALTFQEESWARYYADAPALWTEHYHELCQDPARMPMGPDVEWYEALERAGIMQLVTAREGGPEGLLRGYQISVVRRHTHYCSVLCAFEDSFWLHPSCRKGMTGVKLISESVRLLKARGVQRVFFMSVESYPTDRIFEYLGFTKTHSAYSKWIGA
jgi:L-amino acid N-acyltransferase YncA